MVDTFVPEQALHQVVDLGYQTAEGDQLIYFIRHGESTANVQDPETGIHLTSGKSLEVPLTENGKDEAAQLRAMLGRVVNSFERDF